MNMIIMPVMMPVEKERKRKSLTVNGIEYQEIFADETLRRIKRNGIVYEEVEDCESGWGDAALNCMVVVMLLVVALFIVPAVAVFLASLIGWWFSWPVQWLHLCQDCGGFFLPNYLMDINI